jgi:hypothetical protein
MEVSGEFLLRNRPYNKGPARNGVLRRSSHHFERLSDHIAGDRRPFRKLTETPLTFGSDNCFIIFTGFGHPVKILLSLSTLFRLGL